MIMVEVFKTNVSNPVHASKLIEQIRRNFVGYQASFDLEDCDRIMRVKSTNDVVHAYQLIYFLKSLGFIAEVLPDKQQISASEIPIGDFLI
ncbi:hypothetical protein D3C78_1284310 [compost metagenome]